MAQRPHVPKFGNWEGDNVPYTVYFEKARQNRGGKMINPNDPEENPDMFQNMTTPAPAPLPPKQTRTRPEERASRGAVRPRNEDRKSREEAEYRKFYDSPARDGGRGPATGRPARYSAGSEQSIERSPVHPQYQGKLTGRGSASPAWEGKGSYESSHGTPGRSRDSRIRAAARGDETPDRGAAGPRFGEWDQHPQSAENYTHIFSKVREEKHSEAGNVTASPAPPSYYTRKQQSEEKQKKCCFPWW